MSDVTFAESKSRTGVLPAIDRRESDRQPCDWVTFCEPVAMRTDANLECHWSAQAIDISEGGICFSAERRFELGTRLAVDLPRRVNGPCKSVEATVVHIRSETDGCWTFGCTFVSPLDTEEVGDLLYLELPRYD